MYCRNCKNKKFKKILKIGKQCISSVFPDKKVNLNKKYLLDLFECQKCKLVQLSKIPPLQDMYGQNYGYRTSLSPLMINHMKEKFLNLKKLNIIKKNSNILDIGSNDGTFLNFFKNYNINIFGMDPSAKKFLKYYDKKINVIIDFFSRKKLEEKYKNKKFDLITSFAMFYDIEDPNSFCKDISYLLSDKGYWILEFSYFPLLLKNLTYDQICHEHVTYYTLKTFIGVISKNNLRVVDFRFNEINGGSIEVICCKKNSKIKSKVKKIKKQLSLEDKIDHKAYDRLNNRIENTKKVLNLFLSNVKKNEVIGYGASTKGNIVLNHCEINSKNLKYICDANPYKFGRYTPGSSIKIISKRKMRQLKPKYLLVLIWSFRSEVILQEINFIKSGGKLIFHLPSFHIIDKTNYKSFLRKDFKDFSFEI